MNSESQRKVKVLIGTQVVLSVICIKLHGG